MSTGNGNQILFYWDLFLILNLIMNLFLIGMTGLLRRKRFRKGRLFLAALAGSMQMTIIMGVWLVFQKRATAFLQNRIWLLPVAVVIGWEMLQIAYREHKWKEKIRNFGGLLQVSVLTGGSIVLLQGVLGNSGRPSGITGILLGTAGLFVVFFLGQREAGRREQQSHTMDAVLTAKNGKSFSLRVLFDSGNALVSPYTGEAVMIISRELAEQMDIENKQYPLWIPYHSIGGDGLLPAYRFSSLVLQDGRRKENFLAAVSDRISADDTIQMILNSK